MVAGQCTGGMPNGVGTGAGMDVGVGVGMLDACLCISWRPLVSACI